MRMARQTVDIEEPPVIDLFRRHPPVRQPVDLLVHQFVQEIEALRVPFCPVDQPQVLVDMPPESR